MESQWNATFYGKIELKFQNIFQITVTMNCNCMQGSLNVLLWALQRSSLQFREDI